MHKRKRAPDTVVEGYELKTFHGHLPEDYDHPAHVAVYGNNYCKTLEVSPGADEHMTLETDISSRQDGQSVATRSVADYGSFCMLRARMGKVRFGFNNVRI